MKQASGPDKKPAEAVIKDIRRATLAGPFCETSEQARIKARCREYHWIPDRSFRLLSIRRGRQEGPLPGRLVDEDLRPVWVDL